MPSLRSAMRLSSHCQRGAPLRVRGPMAIRSLSSTPFRLAQGYGDPDGNSTAENPQAQPASNATKHNAEHPGPEPPAEGQGKGAGPTKGGSGSGKSPADSSAQSGGSKSKEAMETGSSPSGGDVKGGGKNPKSKDGLEPKILGREARPDSQEKKAEVEKHNREFEEGYDRPSKGSDEKVDKHYWKGQGGADRES
ncbi:hypothetical protein BJ875DRAFT_463036 [Amylocarpus encephaloides]|uniref:Uncharacterized protein n=1 Tax=Amylocarpus encephaloides TaxID=45428 RepID=A0A9P8C4Q3_9HELO|nr:hypothetical protein BJ875DRAFT_463036 [Amylocarpus encephaloides]